MSESRYLIPNVDLDSMTAEQRMAVVQAALERFSMDDISTLIESAQQMRQRRLEDRRAHLLEKWRAEAAEAGMSLDDLLTPRRRPRRDTVGTGPSKFRGPKGESWSGKGRPPNWLSELEATGSNRDQFRVSGDDA